jgi:hypothetical protein
MVCFTPEIRNQIGPVCFFGPEVRFAPNFRRSDGVHRWSDFDPERSFRQASLDEAIKIILQNGWIAEGHGVGEDADLEIRFCLQDLSGVGLRTLQVSQASINGG